MESLTIGDHAQERRLTLSLTQDEAATCLGVSASTVLNWEKVKTEPPIQALPAILKFLGYNPFLVPKTLPERILAKRRRLGWSIALAAQALGVDNGTWARWKRGHRPPWPRY